MRLAERFGQAPYGAWERMTAAQMAIVVAALQEDEVPTAENKIKQPLREAQPRVNRNVLLGLARKNDPNVWDVKAD